MASPKKAFVPPPVDSWEGPAPAQTAAPAAPTTPAAAAPAGPSSTFTPPPVTSLQGGSGGFTPPPVDSQEDTNEAPSWWDTIANSRVGKQIGNAASSFYHGTVGPLLPGSDDATAAGQGIKDLVTTNPLTTGRAYLQQSADIGGEIGDAAKQGRYGEAVARVPGYLTSSIPGLGSTYDAAVSDALQGNYGKALGTAATIPANIIAGGYGPRVAAGISNLPTSARQLVTRNLKNLNPAPVETAVTALRNRGVETSVGQDLGRPGLQRVEQALPMVPGSETPAGDFYRRQVGQIGQAGRDIAAQVSPTTTNEYGAGQAVNARLQQRIARLKGQSDNLYNQVRSGTSQNPQTVQTGSVTSPIVAPTPGSPAGSTAGTPITTPVMSTIDTPIDLATQRAQLQPVWDDLNRLMPDARKASSPAYAALKNMMTSQDTHVSAMDFDKYLGAVKAIAREGTSPYLTSQSQRLAQQIIGSGEKQLKTALAGADPALPRTLQSARNTVRSYYATADLMDDINNRNQEPGVLFDNLTKGGDRVVNTLKDLQKVAPKEMSQVGRVFMEDLLNKATKEGGFIRAPTIMNQWDQLGPETKKLLFGPHAKDIDDFMLGAKTLTNDKNPSGSAKMIAAMGAYGAGATALQAAITGNVATAAGIGGEMATARAAANVLFAPRTKVPSPNFSRPGALIGAGVSALPSRIGGDQSNIPQFARGGVIGHLPPRIYR